MGQDLKAQNVRPLAAIYGGALFLVAVIHWSVEEVFAISLQLGQQVFVVAAMIGFGTPATSAGSCGWWWNWRRSRG